MNQDRRRRFLRMLGIYTLLVVIPISIIYVWRFGVGTPSDIAIGLGILLLVAVLAAWLDTNVRKPPRE